MLLLYYTLLHLLSIYLRRSLLFDNLLQYSFIILYSASFTLAYFYSFFFCFTLCNSGVFLLAIVYLRGVYFLGLRFGYARTSNQSIYMTLIWLLEYGFDLKSILDAFAASVGIWMYNVRKFMHAHAWSPSL